MNKLTTLVGITAFAATLAACDQDNSQPAAAASTAPAAQAQPAEKAEPAIQLELKGSDGSLKINSD